MNTTLPKVALTILGDRVAIMLEKPKEQTESGFFVAPQAQEKKDEGIVLAMGNGVFSDLGGNSDPHHYLKLGDIVAYKPHRGEDIIMPDENGNKVNIKIMFLEDVLGTLTPNT